MSTERLDVTDGASGYEEAVRKAVSVLDAGGLVAFPTETVYGLGVNAALPEAVDRLRAVKNRPPDKAFTVHVGRPDDLERYVPSPPPEGRCLARKGWPGPLTLIFSTVDVAGAPVMKDLPPGQDRAVYRDGTIGLRCPDARPAVDMLCQVRGPVVATSANPAGEAPAVTGEQAAHYLDGQVDLILDGGRARYAKPSTIVRIGENDCKILRVGVLDERMVRRMMTTNFMFVCSGNTCRSPMAEGICRKLLAERLACSPEDLADRGYVVGSAGTYGLSGSSATPEAVSACASLSVDITGHRASALTPEAVNAADYVFCMTQSHVETVSRLLPGARCSIVRLDPETDVEDPIGGDPELYRTMAERLEGLIQRHLGEIEL